MRAVAGPAPLTPAAPRRRRGRASAAVRLLLVGAVLAGPTGPSPAGEEPAGTGAECPVPAFLDDEEAGTIACWDGLRRGLEDAHLPRVCRRRVPGADAAAWEAVAREVSAAGAPFVVAIGRRSSERVAAAPFLRRDGLGRIPCVLVDLGTEVGGVAFPAALRPAPPAAVVRGLVGLEALVDVLARARPVAPTRTVRLGWSEAAGDAAAWRAAARRAGLDTRLPAEGGAAGFLLDAPLSLGETSVPFPGLLASARAERLPVVSLERGRFGRGATLVVAPDAALVGRVAADAARRLRDGEGADAPLARVVRAVDVLLDLDEADAAGVPVPLAFVAAAHRVRAGEPRGTGGR